MRLATWNVNSVQARLPRLLDWLEEHRGRTWSACRRPRRPTRPSRSRRSGSWATRRPLTAPAGGTGWPSCPGSGWTTCAAGSPASPASPTRRPGRSPPPARAAGSGRSTCRTAGPWTTRTTPTSWPGSRRCATRSPPSSAGGGAAGRVRRLQHRAAPTTTCGTRRRSPAPPTSPRPNGPPWPRLRDLGLTDVPARALKGPALHLLGLPGRHVPQGHGHADRPGPAPARAVAAAVKDAYIDREARKGKGPSDHAPIVVDLRPARDRLARSPGPVTGFLPGHRLSSAFMVALVWFRRDLRVHDHPALCAALAGHERIVPGVLPG